MRRFLATFVAMAVLAVGGWFGLGFLTGGKVGASMPFALVCPTAKPVKVGDITVPEGPVGGFCQKELVNAAHIMNAARAQGIGQRTQAIGVMVAIGESKLRNLDHGDTAGPDSRGIFQQRANGAWGSLADRMDPYTSAMNFFNKLTSINGWQTMDPATLAHVVQGNSDANYYGQFWSKAQTIVKTLTP